MKVEPRWVSVAGLLSADAAYKVPKYQRDYRWDKTEIEDFCGDIENAFNRRKQGQPVDHFFGGIVTVGKAITGAATRETKVIDGQQRLTTVTLLVSALVERYEVIRQQAEAAGDEKEKKLYSDRMHRIRTKLLTVETEINREVKQLNKLQLSEADHRVFEDILAGRPIEEGDLERESHRRLVRAARKVAAMVDDLSAGDYRAAAESLEVLYKVLDQDLTLIDVNTTTDQEAYRLFQVLNDRGVNLAEGDLLRATTLEALDVDGAEQHSRGAANDWDEILRDDTSEIRDQLRWFYTATLGRAPARARLFDSFRDDIFPECRRGAVPDVANARALAEKISKLKEAVQIIRKLEDAEWPYATVSGISNWDRKRLEMLVRELRHTVCMPLLLAARLHIGPRDFSELVQAIERFAFRYKNVVGAHIGKAQAVYFSTAGRLMRGERLDLQGFRTRLNELIDEKADDDLFIEHLKRMRYSKTETNRPLRYLLIAIEDHWRWYFDGARGRPAVLDKSRVIDISDATIEHVYPQNPDPKEQNHELDEKVSTIGNLTILGPRDNVELGNASFDEKRKLLAETTLAMNRWYADKKAGPEMIRDRENAYFEIAKRVFRA